MYTGLSIWAYICGIIVCILTFTIVFAIGSSIDNAIESANANSLRRERYAKAARATVYFCPYCGSKTTGKEIKCLACGGPLGSADAKYKKDTMSIGDIFGFGGF